jgi:K+-transporting ATPase ATPase C chain
MGKTLRPALVLLGAFTALLGLGYPLLVAGVARLAFPWQAGGSLVVVDGSVVGSRLVGQQFSVPRYFWGRPSATAPGPYNGAASGGANLGPSNPALRRAVQERVGRLRSADPGNLQPIPVDLVTASASGLDPHISLAAARYQVPRVARLGGLPEAQVLGLVEEARSGGVPGLLGEPGVNVLLLNGALQRLANGGRK